MPWLSKGYRSVLNSWLVLYKKTRIARVGPHPPTTKGKKPTSSHVVRIVQEPALLIRVQTMSLLSIIMIRRMWSVGKRRLVVCVHHGFHAPTVVWVCLDATFVAHAEKQVYVGEQMAEL